MTFCRSTSNTSLDRGYFVAAGLEAVLEFLEEFHFAPTDLEYLDTLRLFSDEFLQVRDPVFLGYPEAARSSGTIWYGNAPGRNNFV